MVSQLQNEEKVIKMQTKAGMVIEQFLKEHSKGSINTELAYKGDIKRFLKEVFHKSIETVTVEELDILDYDSLTQYIESFQDMSNNTVNRHISTIKGMYNYLKARSIIKSDISYLGLIKLLNNDGTEIEVMSVDVVNRYIGEAGRETHNAEIKQKLMMLAADQGIRLSALLKLTWRNFVEREDGVLVTGFDKGNKKYEKVMSHDVYKDILKLRKGNSVDSKVFAPLSTKNVTDMMIRIKRNLGYEEREYSFHSLRKAAVTFGYRHSGGDILEAQRIAEHSNVNTTQGYVKALDYGVTGMFSLANHDPLAYKKLSHEELLYALDGMSNDFLHILNSKILQQDSENK